MCKLGLVSCIHYTFPKAKGCIGTKFYKRLKLGIACMQAGNKIWALLMAVQWLARRKKSSNWSQYTFQANLQDMTATCRQQSFATSTSNPTGVSRQISPPDQNLLDCSIGLFCHWLFSHQVQVCPDSNEQKSLDWVSNLWYYFSKRTKKKFPLRCNTMQPLFQVGLQREQKCNYRTVTTFF